MPQKLNKNQIIIFSDGSSRGNPGRGGYGAIFIHNDRAIELGKRFEHTTNNKMELQSVIDALCLIDKNKNDLSNPLEITIFTDSKYVIKGATEWIFGWKINGWKTANKEEVKNRELWEEMSDLISGKKINWKLLPGHAGVLGNERCDEIATKFADGETVDLYDEALDKYKINNLNADDILKVFYNPELIQEAKDLKKSGEIGGSGGARKSGGKSSAKAYSYVSFVDGKIHIDNNWSDCEKRVKGKSGALYKKAISKSDEEETIRIFRGKK